MKLSDMRQILQTGGIQLTKSLGQNFLHDGNQLRRIAETAELSQADKVLEVGPGLGPLTELLVARAGEVLAIEKDARLVTVLRERFAAAIGAGSLRLLEDDALEYLRREPRDWSAWKLVANLPYSVASPILVELALPVKQAGSVGQTSGLPVCGASGPALVRRGPQRMVATLQLEVAKRLMAKAGEADYGVLTLLVQLDYEPHGWFKIPAGCFFPEPDVDSACVCLVRRAQPLLEPARAAAFVKLVKRSFSQRRKMMRKLLSEDWPSGEVDRAFARVEPAPLPAQARAETVALEQFVQLTHLLS